MSFRSFHRNDGFAVRNAGAVFACLLLTVCAAPAATNHWAKSGADDAATSREIGDCRSQANAALANEQGINQDIGATLGRNWQMGNTQGIEAQSMSRQAAGYADRILDQCMRAKGFVKEG